MSMRCIADLHLVKLRQRHAVRGVAVEGIRDLDGMSLRNRWLSRGVGVDRIRDRDEPLATDGR